ncbi:DUF2975 domain-containing protein [Mesorhizobium marinum]|uniref:DUF2975 domain-containing protein n=1 Tax=Mesorhizobium marinum TaxID=3228790 RepID=UPI003465C93F
MKAMPVPISAERNARSAARAMRRATLALGVILALGLAYAAIRAAFDRQWLDGLIAANHAGVDSSSPSALALLFILFAAQVSVFTVALHAVWRTFDALAEDQLLPAEAGRWLRRAGLCFAASAILTILAVPVVSLAASLHASAGQRFVSLGLGSGEVMTLFIAGVLVALGHVLSLAAEVGEDNRQIV